MVFNHSVKVPTQYKRIASVIKTALQQKKSLKTLVFEQKHARMQGMQAILKLYTDYRSEIDRAIEESKILEENPRLDPILCKVLVTEIILGRKQLIGESKPVITVREHRDKLLAAFGGEQSLVEKKSKDKKPRYVRVNTNILSMSDVFEMLAAEKFVKKEASFETYAEYLEAIRALEENEFIVDMHLADLLVFHPKKRYYWARHHYVLEKKLVLQDKATCLVAELLEPPPGSVVLDMCAAPGMKTIHVSNKMQNKGKIYAVEKDPNRCQLLRKMVKDANATIVEIMHADALELDSKTFPSVEYIVVDPSCSGSGMQSRMSVTSDEKDPERLNKLAGLQIKMLSHALTAFPNAKRVAYSTCSLYEEENEMVVKRCLKKCPHFKLLSGKKALRNKWLRVGNPAFKNIGKNCLYSRPSEDLTDGFFIAVFERRADEENDK